MKYSLAICIIFFLFSCSSPQDRKLNYTLKMAGENRPELEKVLEHYKNDPEKLAAARFLIENMYRHFAYQGEPVIRVKEALRCAFEDNTNIPEEVASAAKSYSQDALVKVYDATVITADYLIENIESAFDHWKNRPWNRYLSFEDFCEYLLPYRVGNEQLENWRGPYYKKYGRVLDSLYSGTDVVEAANQINQYIGRTETLVYNSSFPNLSPGPLFFLDHICGSCFDLRDAAIYIFRSVGIPAAGVFYPRSPNEGMSMHTWAVVKDTNGRDVTVRDPGMEVGRDIEVEYKKGKVYRNLFGEQRIDPNRMKDQNIPDFFKNPYIKDITENYAGINKLEISIAKKGNPYLYLGVQTSWRTTLIDIAKAVHGKAVFHNVDTGLVYQLFYTQEGQLIPAGYPVLFDGDHTHTFAPAAHETQKFTLYRKYRMADWLYNHINHMVGSTLEGSANANFFPLTFKYNIRDSVETVITQEFSINTEEKVQYIRFTSDTNKRINLAEVSFFTEDSDDPLQNIGLEGAAPLIDNTYNNGYLSNICDGDPLTYYMTEDKNAIVVFDLNSPVKLSKIIITPRTDDNFIRIGDLYELFYHAGKEGWKSLGQREADQLFLHYDNIPVNALLWLQDLTQGQEEQVFFIRNGKQIFTGFTGTIR